MSFADVSRSDREYRRISPVFWVLLAALGTSGWATWSGYGSAGFGVFLFVVAGWMVSLCLHEYGHARTALHGGDITVGAKGYLTLNPFKYTHALYSIVMPLFFLMIGGIGLPGGAVYIERDRIRGRLKHSLVSAAGPLVNIAFVVLLLVPVGQGWLDSAPGTADVHGYLAHPLVDACAYLGMLQLSATLLNLLPVPGLDGYGIIEPWLSYKTRAAVRPFAPYGMLVVFALLFQPDVNRQFFDLLYSVMDLFGVNPNATYFGHELFRFWNL
jgi:Zn-dependent protease